MSSLPSLGLSFHINKMRALDTISKVPAGSHVLRAQDYQLGPPLYPRFPPSLQRPQRSLMEEEFGRGGGAWPLYPPSAKPRCQPRARQLAQVRGQAEEVALVMAHRGPQPPFSSLSYPTPLPGLLVSRASLARELEAKWRLPSVLRGGGQGEG